MVDESKVAQATRHVLTGRRIVQSQRSVVANLKEAGLDTALAESLLDQFERVLATFEEDLARIQENSN